MNFDIKLIENTDFGSYILKDMYSFYSNAAAVCFEENRFSGTASLIVDFTEQTIFQLNWECLSLQVKDMHNDLIYAAEQGAYCIAFLIIHKLTNYKIIRQAKRKTGFDYWLGDKEENLPFTNKAILEVSGLLKGNKNQINQRMAMKEIQIKQSDGLHLPSFIVITEFSEPISKVVKNEKY